MKVEGEKVDFFQSLLMPGPAHGVSTGSVTESLTLAGHVVQEPSSRHPTCDAAGGRTVPVDTQQGK